MKFIKMFSLGNGISGTDTFTGTSGTLPATPSNGQPDITVGIQDGDFFFGQISNLSSVDVQVTLKSVWKGADQTIHTYDLRAFESLDMKVPLRTLNVIVNGTALIRGMGIVVRPESGEEEAVIWANSGLFESLSSGRSYLFQSYDHTDISTATTTTIDTPEEGNTIRVYKITVSTQGSCRVTLQWTDSDGSSNVNQIGTLNFTGEGTFVYDFGDRGIECPNGADALLRLVSNNTAVLDIDVISQDVLNQ